MNDTEKETFQKKMDENLVNWENRLLDLSKRNRMINYTETKRTTVALTEPGAAELYKRIAVDDEELAFKQSDIAGMGASEKAVISLFDKLGAPLLIKSKGDISAKLKGGTAEESELRITLKNMRAKARLAIEEQGSNILYLSFGFIEWDDILSIPQRRLKSPLVLLPATLRIKSINEPFKLSKASDEPIINPALAYYLKTAYGITLPTFDSETETLTDYFNKIEEAADTNNWEFTDDVSLALLSFLKIPMYHDLVNHEDAIRKHPVIKAMAGDLQDINDACSAAEEELPGDAASARDGFQILSADSSQLEAIEYSRKGVSFIIPGPPGTGKSQTIANIIAAKLADGKKVLFVSEKAAALEVVYRRLEAANLGEFCLPLHNYKANKNDILSRMDETLELKKNPVSVTDNSLQMLDELTVLRNELNGYVNEIHKKIEPLGTSFYEIFGICEELSDIPLINISITDIADITKEQFTEKLNLISSYTLFVQKSLNGNIKNNPWKGFAQSAEEFDYSRKMQDALSICLSFLKGCKALFESIPECTGLNGGCKAGSTAEVLEAIEKLTAVKAVPGCLDDEYNIQDAREKAKKAKELYSELAKIENSFTDVFSSGMVSANSRNYKSALSRMNDTAQQLADRSIVSLTGDEVISRFDDLMDALQNAKAYADGIYSEFDNIKTLLKADALPAKVRNISIISKYFCTAIPLPLLSSGADLVDINNAVTESKSLFNAIKKIRNSILEIFKPGIFNKNCDEIINKLNRNGNTGNRPGNTSGGILNRLSGIIGIRGNAVNRQTDNYRDDIKELINENCYISDSRLLPYLNDVKSFREDEGRLKENIIKLRKYFGTLICKTDAEINWETYENIDWALLAEFVKGAKIIRTMYSDSVIPDEIAQALSDSGSTVITETAKRTQTLEGYAKAIEQAAKDDSAPISYKSFNEECADVISADIVECLEIAEEFNKIKDELIPGKNVSVPELYNALSGVEAYFRQSDEIEKSAPDFTALFGSCFNGRDTDWEGIENFLRIVLTEKNRNDDFSLLKLAELSDERKNEIYKRAKALTAKIPQYTDKAAWVDAQFDGTVKSSTLDEYLTLTENRLGSISMLEGWADYTRSRENCIEAGLGEIIEYVEENECFDKAENIFRKAFYTKWFGAIHDMHSGSISKFRKSVQEARVDNFCRLDNSQFVINEARIREKLIAELPSRDTLLKSNTELGILNNELGKKRKMPLRRLFKKIPGLLLTLKPCIMMSPLSVAYFLESDQYRFDTVIFDEASQVFPEDAIGAIIRAKQVIIAGDSKQLPPTAFFKANTAEEGEYDSDDDEGYDEEDVVADSILEKVDGILPTRSLLWHYRSRHEGLIAFSNREMYDNKLITFPSNITFAEDTGVEFVYVPDGVYESGGKNCNIREAEECVRLIEEHILKHPERSLGVIAFSIKQQAAIEHAVTAFRKQNPQYEDFFDDAKEEPFFIKNLENVQGDERDTIIFSVCYAKDASGKMNMRFGPLSTSGGERRLNVAITRAKYNIKLVSSITSADIKSTVTSEGARLLKAYLAYAQNREYSKATARPASVFEAKDIFCDAVCAYLSELGYTARRRVGCSDYTVDIAVENPDLPGEYIAGIECDGNTYASAKNAHDRDNLRLKMLNTMGWNMYRIWSAAWYKNAESEKKLLKEFLEKALSGTVENKPEAESVSFDDIIEAVIPGKATNTKAVTSGHSGANDIAAPDKNTPDANTQVINDQVTEGQVTEGQFADDQFADDQVTEGQITEGQITEGQITEGQITEGQVTEGQVIDAQAIKGSEYDEDDSDTKTYEMSTKKTIELDDFKKIKTKEYQVADICDKAFLNDNKIYQTPEDNLENIANKVNAVLAVENPVHILFLCERLLPLFHYSEVNDHIITTVIRAIDEKLKDKGIITDGDFVRYDNEEKEKEAATPRVPGNSEESVRRPLAYVYPYEFIPLLKTIFEVEKTDTVSVERFKELCTKFFQAREPRKDEDVLKTVVTALENCKDNDDYNIFEITDEGKKPKITIRKGDKYER